MKRSLVCLAVVAVSLALVGCWPNAAVGGDNDSPRARPVAVPQATDATGPSEIGSPPKAPSSPPPASPALPHTPAMGTPERKAILDALRVPVQKALHQPVVFKVDHIAVQGGWAFVEGQPLRPDGSKIDYAKTPYARAVKDGFFGDDFSGLLRTKNGAWIVVTDNVGATDVVWEPWAKDFGAPDGIFPGH